MPFRSIISIAASARGSETAAADRDDLHIGALFLKAVAQQNKADFEVVLHERQAERYLRTIKPIVNHVPQYEAPEDSN